MRFSIQRMAGPDCGSLCPQVIVAEGVIEPDTPATFAEFARGASNQPGLRGVVFINSPGGNVVAAMELGDEFRRLKIAAIVAGFASAGEIAGPVSGQCVSACVYALMGAVKRVAPPTSRVALHRMALPASESFQLTEGKSRTAGPQLVGVVVRYATRMGVNPEVVKTAESLDPGHVYELSQAEIRRWGLATSRF